MNRKLWWAFPPAVFGLALAVLLTPSSKSDGAAETARKEEKKEAGKSQTAELLPIGQVVLFSSGVGYFQREGQVEGDQRVDLSFPTSDINDLIKSMTLRDIDGGRISAVSYDGNAPIERTLQSFAVNLSSNPSFGAILTQARGEKVEVVLQQTNATQPGTLTGSIIGIEKQRQAAGKDAAVEVEILNLWCADGIRALKLPEVQRIRFLNPIMESEFKKALETVSLSHDTQKKSVSIHFAGQGKRNVKVGYVIENPLWKTSYRLVLGKEKEKEQDKEKEKAKPYLQGWAVVENVTDEDWNGVKMALISGRPISFQMNLYDALFIKRPVVEPELFASLRPPTYSGGLSGGDAVARPAPMAPPGIGGGGGGFAGGGPGGPPMAGKPGDGRGYALEKSKDASAAYRRALQADLEQKMDLGKSVASAASASKLGDYFQYVIDHPVTLARQKSALLPIVGKDVEGEKVSIFNERTHPKFPLLGLVFTNTTGMHLTQGPITVYEGSTYAGDARILDLQKGERRLLSYAIDLGTEVQTIPATDNGRVTSLKIVKGVVWTKTRVKDTKTYKMVNRNEDNRVVMVEHPNRTDFTLTTKDKPWETAADVHRFKVEVPAGKTIDYVVSEEKEFGSQVSLTNSDDQNIRIFLNETVTSEKAKEAFNRALQFRGKLADTQRELQQLQRKLTDIERDQTRLRQNLREMPPTAEAYKRYLKKFDDQETEIEQLQSSIKKMQDQEFVQRKDYEGWLANLSVD